jgi:hypothetical protein
MGDSIGANDGTYHSDNPATGGDDPGTSGRSTRDDYGPGPSDHHNDFGHPLPDALLQAPTGRVQ